MKNCIIIFTIFFILTSCSKKEKINHPIDIKFFRFEKTLFQSDFNALADSSLSWNLRFGDFYDIFNYKVINIGDHRSPAYPEYLKSFVTDYNINQLYQEVMVLFPENDPLEYELELAFGSLTKHFEKIPIPTFYTFISGFNQSIITSDSVLAIGLDRYLGPDHEFYKRLGYPNYIRYLLNKKRITNDCLKSWLMTQYDMEGDKNLLNHLIYQGKICYSLKRVIPEIPDSIVLGMSPQGINWCKENEQSMWIYLVEYKKIFSTDQLTISKFINEAPFTTDFKQNSPGKAALFNGFRIVEEFMKHSDDITLDSLFKIHDPQTILRISKYKP